MRILLNPFSLGGRGRRKGSSLVESALVIMPLMCMVLFIMDMGRVLLTEQYVTERARAGLRQAVVSTWGTDATSVKNYICYNDTTAPQQGGPGMFGVQPSQVTVSLLGTAATPDYRLQAQISGLQITTFIPYIATKYTAPTITVTVPAQSLGATN
jgi:Flp pilus assembly protein TadG